MGRRPDRLLGPPTGFALSADYNVSTSFKAIFSAPGEYEIKLALYDVAGEAVLAEKTITVEVKAEPADETTPPTDNDGATDGTETSEVEGQQLLDLRPPIISGGFFSFAAILANCSMAKTKSTATECSETGVRVRPESAQTPKAAFFLFAWASKAKNAAFHAWNAADLPMGLVDKTKSVVTGLPRRFLGLLASSGDGAFCFRSVTISVNSPLSGRAATCRSKVSKTCHPGPGLSPRVFPLSCFGRYFQ